MARAALIQEGPVAHDAQWSPPPAGRFPTTTLCDIIMPERPLDA